MGGGRAPRLWLPALAWLGLILSSVPLSRSVQELVRDSVGRQAWLVVVLVILALALVATAVLGLRRLGRVAWWRLPWLLLTAGAYGGYSWHLRQAPEEALHFVEYGVLGLLIFRALRPSLPDRLLFPAVLLTGCLVGCCDELLQWLMPGRFWDLRDLWVNGLAIALALLALALVFRPAELRIAPSARSVRRCCGLAAALVICLVAAVSNTPPRIQAMARSLPAMSYLVERGSVMTEYGYLHELPGGARQYSRLTWDELVQSDRQRATEVAGVLDEYRSDEQYRAFLWDYPPFGDPFVHEIRVHLFRRDRYLMRLASEQPSRAEKRRMATTAWREDQLLQACCGATLAASSYRLEPAPWQALSEWIQRDEPYTSAVSSHLLVRFRQGHAWALAGALLLLLAGAARRWGR